MKNRKDENMSQVKTKFGLKFFNLRWFLIFFVF